MVNTVIKSIRRHSQEHPEISVYRNNYYNW